MWIDFVFHTSVFILSGKATEDEKPHPYTVKLQTLQISVVYQARMFHIIFTQSLHPLKFSFVLHEHVIRQKFVT